MKWSPHLLGFYKWNDWQQWVLRRHHIHSKPKGEHTVSFFCTFATQGSELMKSRARTLFPDQTNFYWWGQKWAWRWAKSNFLSLHMIFGDWACKTRSRPEDWLWTSNLTWVLFANGFALQLTKDLISCGGQFSFAHHTIQQNFLQFCLFKIKYSGHVCISTGETLQKVVSSLRFLCPVTKDIS